jgi:hypothetical protein
MKIAMFFARPKKPRRAAARKASFAQVTTDWATRDWADLPVHHPSKD